MSPRSFLLCSLIAGFVSARTEATGTSNQVAAFPTQLADPLVGLANVDCGCWNACTLKKEAMKHESADTAINNLSCPADCGKYLPPQIRKQSTDYYQTLPSCAIATL